MLGAGTLVHTLILRPGETHPGGSAWWRVAKASQEQGALIDLFIEGNGIIYSHSEEMNSMHFWLLVR